MSTQAYLPEDTIIQRGVEALMTVLGPIDTTRFLNLPSRQILDYVEWHRQWQERLDPEIFFDEVFGVEST